MKTEKMSFKNIKDVLSRDEMKMIMAGSGACPASYCLSATAGQVTQCFNLSYQGNGVMDCFHYGCCMAGWCGGACA